MPAKLPPEVQINYHVERELGVGGQGHTVLARRKEDGEQVVLKTLDFVELSSWKDLDLLQREMEVLRELRHPAVPRLYEHYPKVAGGEQPDVFVVVQEYVEGRTLEELLDEAEGPLMDEAEARSFLDEMLGVLEYLHGLNPPVIHRDIKPSNIIRRPDGRHVLIDFGAARASGVNTGSSTFVGTNGYMPPEQLMGRSEPRSDLFAVGATTLQLMSGIAPPNLARDDLSFRLDVVEMSPDFASYLRILTHPTPDLRYRSAERARSALHDRHSLAVLGRDTEHDFSIERTSDGTVIARLPHEFSGTNKVLALLVGAILLAGGPILIPIGLVLALYIFGSLQTATVEIDDRELRWRRKFGGLGYTRSWKLDELNQAKSADLEMGEGVLLQRNDGAQAALRTNRFDSERARWLARLINNYIERHR